MQIERKKTFVTKHYTCNTAPEMLYDCFHRCMECQFKYSIFELTPIGLKYVCKFCITKALEENYNGN